MNLKLPAAVLNATRLVRGGNLMEATNAIRRALVGSEAPPVTRPQVEAGAAIEGTFRVVDVQARVKPGQFLARKYSNAAGTRQYKVYLPAAATGQALPLIVMLHGCKQAADDFAAATRMNALADEHGFVVVYPQQTGKANGSRCWNWFEPGHQQRERGEPSLIAGITREVIATYGIDARRVYIAGLSAGGAMAAVMATKYPDVYAAVGVHSGLAYGSALDVPSAFAAMRGDGSPREAQQATASGAHRVPVIVFHGDNDTTVHPSNGDEVIAQAAAATAAPASEEAALERSVEHGRAQGREYTRITYRDPGGKPLVEQWLVHGAAHAWFGGSARGSFSDPEGPDASREMLRFFLAHERT